MLDLFTREIVGWAIDSHMRKSLVHNALKMAEFRNGFTVKTGVGGLIFHSDKSLPGEGRGQSVRRARNTQPSAEDGLPAIDEWQGQLL